MKSPSRTITRRTAAPHRGRQVVLIVPPHCDFVTLRLAGTRTCYDVELAAVYDMAVRQHVLAAKRAKAHEKKLRRG